MKVFVQTALLSASIAVPASSFAYAAENSKDTIVVTGRKTSGGEFGEKSGIPIEKVPQGVQVLSAEDLLEQNVRNIGDALRSVPSANAGTPRTSAYQSFSLKSEASSPIRSAMACVSAITRTSTLQRRRTLSGSKC